MDSKRWNYKIVKKGSDMKRQLAQLFIAMLIALAFISCAIIPSVDSEVITKSKFENMVDATVLINYPHNSKSFCSGVFWKDNVIVTAAHCLKDDQGNREPAVTIELVDGTKLESSDFYIDEEEDVGFIFVDAQELYIADVSNEPVELGDPIYIAGTPGNRRYKFSLIHGIVSYVGRDLPPLSLKDVIQTDTDGGAGMSGGPLYNEDGKLIGIYNAQLGVGGFGINFCENMESILAAYERYQSTSK